MFHRWGQARFFFFFPLQFLYLKKHNLCYGNTILVENLTVSVKFLFGWDMPTREKGLRITQKFGLPVHAKSKGISQGKPMLIWIHYKQFMYFPNFLKVGEGAS